MSLLTLGLAFLAGVLSILSPCVLPLLPIIIGTAASRHRYGPLALAVGLALSFVAVGLFVATIGFAAGLDGNVFRHVSAAMMVAVGAVLVSPALQRSFASAAAPVAAWAGTAGSSGSGSDASGVPDAGLWGQFSVGVLLGAVWSPCVGPTLGAASVLAAQGRDLPAVALIMLVFGLGAALPLLVIGSLSREVLLRLRGSLLSAGSAAKVTLGAVLLIAGLAILTGADKQAETVLVAAMPDWLTALTTRY